MVGLCRLCASLRKMDVLTNLNDDCNELLDKLRKCYQLNIKLNGALPNAVCQECIDSLNSSYKFYTKVKEAQETLQALYPDASTTKETETVQSTLAKTLAVMEENTKQRKLSSENLKYALAKTEIPSEQIKVETIILSQNKDVLKQTQIKKKITKETSSIQGDVIQEVYDILEMTKEEEKVFDKSYELLDSFDESIEDITEIETENYLNYQDEMQEQLLVEHGAVEETNAQNPLEVENKFGDQKQPEVETEHTGDVFITDNQLDSELQYLETYDDEEEDEEIETIIDIEQTESKAEHVMQLPAQLQINSWKSYKHLCFICEENCTSFLELKRHIAHQHKIILIDKIQYKCFDCKKIIPRYNFFLNHVRSKHHRELKLKCDVCDLSFQNFKALSYHRSANCAEANNYAHIVPCTQCFKSFHNTYGFQNHCKYQHNCSKVKVKYKCMQCNKEFKYKSCLKSHEQIHSELKKFACSYCDKKFYSKVGLEQHLYFHVEEKYFTCNICSKKYKTFQTLEQHQKLHTDEKPFKCDFCDKYFGKKVQKLTHERSHTGEMPYDCQQCDKRFRYRSALNAHKKIHTGDKPYSCEYCAKTFADSSNRNKHVRRIHINSERKENVQE